MKYIISTLGCKVNQYETQAIEAELRLRGHVPAAPGEYADAVIINTCAVTAESGRKSRQTVRRLRSENPGCVTGVLGCYSQLSPDDAESLGADVVYGTDKRMDFVSALEKAAEEKLKSREINDPFRRFEIEYLPGGAMDGRTRAMLKLQDGCVNFCTYCIIPYTRGRLRSLPVDRAVEEVSRLRDAGYGELVITGIEIASYGVDLPGRPSLADAVCAMEEAAGEMRLHLGSLEPTVVTEEFCRRLSQAGRLCRHFHLSLQSGCDRTLKAMNRKYDTARFYESAELLRKYFPGCAITCDLIAGFPGETEEDWQSTLTFIEKCGFSAMHIFPYSRRPGTPADKMPNQCTRALKAKRVEEGSAVARRMTAEYLASCVGQTFPVLFETEEGGVCTGHTDTYVLASVEGTGLRGQTIDVHIDSVLGDTLLGRVASPAAPEL